MIQVEGVYSKKEDMIQEIYLHGDSSQSFCVAIVVPVKAAIENIAKSKNVQGSYEEQLQNKDVRTEFVSKLNVHAKSSGLKQLRADEERVPGARQFPGEERADHHDEAAEVRREECVQEGDRGHVQRGHAGCQQGRVIK